jgi:hypothetical protein
LVLPPPRPASFLRRNHPAGMLRNFRERDDAISPFPRKSTPVLLESNVFPTRFLRISPLTAADLITVRPRVFSPRPSNFPAPLRAAPAASSLACPHLAIRPQGLGGHRPADRRPRFNVRHPCPARHG